MKIFSIKAGEPAYVVIEGPEGKQDVREIQSNARKLTAQLGKASAIVKEKVLSLFSKRRNPRAPHE